MTESIIPLELFVLAIMFTRLNEAVQTHHDLELSGNFEVIVTPGMANAPINNLTDALAFELWPRGTTANAAFPNERDSL